MQFIKRINSSLIYGGELKENKRNDDGIYLNNINCYKNFISIWIKNFKFPGSKFINIGSIPQNLIILYPFNII